MNIKDNTQVYKGSLIGDGVVVGPSAILGPFERLSKRRDVNDATPNDEDGEVDSDLEDVEASAFGNDLHILTDAYIKFTDQDSVSNTLGNDSNALVWPKGPSDDAEEDELDNHKTERYLRLGAPSPRHFIYYL